MNERSSRSREGLKRLLDSDSVFAIAAIVLFGLLVAFYVVLMVNMDGISAKTEDIKEHPYTVTVAAGRAETLLMQVRTLDDRLAFTRSVETVDSVETEFEAIDQQLRAQLDIIAERHRSGAERAQGLVEKYEEFRAQQDALVKMALEGAGEDETARFLSENVDPRIDGMLDDVAQIINGSSRSFDLLYDTVAESREDTIATATILMAAVLVALILFIVVIREKNRQQHALQEDLRRAMVAAQGANRAKTRFLSSVSHDIRTPLTAIIGLTDIAAEYANEPGRVVESLDKIKVSSHHLLNLVNDTLDMSKIESGQIDLNREPLDVGRLVDTLVSIVRPQADTKRLAFSVKRCNVGRGLVLGDEMRVSQILINLLGNAVKYTEPCGCVTFAVDEIDQIETERLFGRSFEVSRSRRSGDARPRLRAFRFVVEDDGIGMTEEFVARIFEPFEREDCPTRFSVEGTGLGMSIAKNLIDLMGGTIAVQSKQGSGSRFTLELPFEACDDEACEAEASTSCEEVPVEAIVEDREAQREPRAEDVAGESPQAEGDASGKADPPSCDDVWPHVRVLLAEDNDIVGEIAEEFIRGTGASVDRAWDGVEAFDLLRGPTGEQYDIVFMDVQMPRMDGLEAARAIADDCKSRGCERPPIVAMTANAYVEDRQRAFEAGMDGYAVKPIGKEEICRLFETYVKPKGGDGR